MIKKLEAYIQNKKELETVLKYDSAKDIAANIEKEISDVEEFIFSCSDNRVRRIMELKFLEGHSWYYVATQIGIDRSTAQKALRAYIGKYLKK